MAALHLQALSCLAWGALYACMVAIAARAAVPPGAFRRHVEIGQSSGTVYCHARRPSLIGVVGLAHPGGQDRPGDIGQI